MSRKRNRKKKHIGSKRQSDVVMASVCLDSNVGSRLSAVSPDLNLRRVHEDELDVVERESQLVSYDENLLERVRTQWLFGDWISLAQLKREAIRRHPDRGKLAILAAAGHMQCGSMEQAREYVRLAQDWGCGKQLVSRIMIAGVYNSLGRAAAIGNQQNRALRHFEKAIKIGTPGNDIQLLMQVRTVQQVKQLGLNTSGFYLHGGEGEARLENVSNSSTTDDTHKTQSLVEIHQNWLEGHWESLVKFDNADLSRGPNRADLALYAACGYQQLVDIDGLQRCIRIAQEWGCPQEKVKTFLIAGIRNSLAITETLAGQYDNAAKNFVAALRVDETMPDSQNIRNRILRELSNLRNIDIEQVIQAIVKHMN